MMSVMQVEMIKTVQDLQTHLKQLGDKSVGLVPTMGALHSGHGELIKRAKSENDIVIVSIFVNPTQFGPLEDFASYPRDLLTDSEFCEQLGVDIIFAPSEDEIYGRDGGISFDPGPAATVLCGASRPGHFNGVLQIVAKLFMITKPTRAYFGQKDAQQLALIDMLVRDYYFPIEIIPVAIVRENDGLAKSSRNLNLTADERQEAVVLYSVLQEAKKGILAGEALDEILTKAKNRIEETSAKVDYIELLNYPDLTAITSSSTTVVLAAAIQFPKVRLIDNIIFGK